MPKLTTNVDWAWSINQLNSEKLNKVRKWGTLKKYVWFLFLDRWAEYQIWERNGIFDEKGAMWCDQQDEVTTKYQEKMLLVREEDEFPAEIARIGTDLLEAYRELL